MATVHESSVLFTGSVPAESVEAVMRTCAHDAGSRLFALPDGELGERAKWAGCLPALTYRDNPHLEEVPEESFPQPLDSRFRSKGVETFRIRDGVDQLRIDNLPYAAAAAESYAIFKHLREAGEIPPDLRFQMAIPTPYAAIRAFFPDVSSWPRLFAAITTGLREQVVEALDAIPADDLVVQLDVASEIVDAYEAEHELNDPERAAQIRRDYSDRDYLGPITEVIPDEALLGYHLCLGTHASHGGWPGAPIKDLGGIVDLANRIARNTPRRIDYMHLPVIVDADDAFFAPLRDLDVGEARIFLGVESGDGVDAMMRRIGLARAALSSFGIAHYCGYGRDDAHRVPELIRDLAQGADRLTV